MAANNLKEYSVDWILGGLLMMCLISFSVGFMFVNNSDGFGSSADSVFDSTSSGTETSLDELTTDSNTILNITANTNPEVGELGSRDSVASGFLVGDIAKSKWDAAQEMFAWIFSGAIGQMLIGIITGLIGISLTFFIYKFVKGWS